MCDMLATESKVSSTNDFSYLCIAYETDMSFILLKLSTSDLFLFDDGGQWKDTGVYLCVHRIRLGITHGLNSLHYYRISALY